jgi:cytochrome P450
MAASLDLVAYYVDLVERRRKDPGDDLTSALLTAEVDGDRLEVDEVIAFLFLMVVAGNETTTKLLGNAVFHLTAHPDQRAAVWADPSSVPRWIEETLRYDTSSQVLARHLRADVTLHRVTAPAGAKLLVALGSANRDERVFSRADEYDVHRDPDEVGRLISFGGGRHFCLGAHLARLEARVALDELVRRTATVHVDRDRARRVHSTNVRGFASLPVTVVER